MVLIYGGCFDFLLKYTIKTYSCGMSVKIRLLILYVCDNNLNVNAV